MINENVLGQMLTALADSFKKERQQTEPYKKLFKGGSTHTGLLRELEMSMTGNVHDAADVYEQRHGIEINDDQYCMLLALPLLAHIAERDAEKNEGATCCVDKAYYILSEQFKKLGDKTNGGGK